MKMVYHWSEVREAGRMAESYKWRRRLRKNEHFCTACELVKLYDNINDTLRNPILCSYYPEEYRRVSYDFKSITGADLDRARKECELHCLNMVHSLLAECESGELSCDFEK